MSNKQSSIEWLIEHFGGIENCTPDFRYKIEQAKEMHKQEIINAIDSFYEYKNWPKELPTKGEQYYKETFVK